ncbi:MAG: DUF3243 domain-containing protein [Novibacillus thermophilus]|jgi:hypothetical protein|uniref:DUF3243 domain-containing protein n=1 Tax=Novibacillus thermophilus TaxID=1471761 RepID=A0A1U9K9T8_9BACL|nr:DUF3243 domain-containing protein [Novibacillus thermophilus]AQS56827.1 hypothetical protein B0W44_14800 [Novibacillus thermophilus]
MSVLENFEDWKGFLHDRVEQARSLGMDNQMIANMAQEIGDYLAQEVHPENGEEKLLKQMWEVSTEEEQQTLANIMVKLVGQTH